jgi:hypothetical protein
MKNIHRIVCMITVLLIASLACNLGSTTSQSESKNATAVAMTLTTVAIQDQASTQNSQPEQPFTLVPPTAMTSPVTPPSPTFPTTTLQAVAIPCDRAGFVTETTPDNSKMSPGQTFSKSWTLKNNGSCPWTSGYTLVFERGDAMGAKSVSPLTAVAVPPGQNVEVAVTLSAPNQPGTYQGYFMLQSPGGTKFGLGDKGDKAFWVKIVVEAPAAPTVHKSGTLEIPQTYTADLDTGTVGPSNGEEVQHAAPTATERLLEFRTQAAVMNAEPSFDDCKNTNLGNLASVSVFNMGPNFYVCYRTDQGRLGYLNFSRFSPSTSQGQPDKLYLDFITWVTP